MPTSGTVDWEQAKRCLLKIDQTSRDFLSRALLIGGAATWFYRQQLVKADDPDFNLQASRPTDEDKWVSRDIDFTGVLSEDAFLLLPGTVEKDKNGKKYIEVEGVRLGFAQVCLTFDATEAYPDASVAQITVEDKIVQFLVVDPIRLYYEKQKLCRDRRAPNDFQHFALLREFIAYELVRGAERVLEGIATVPETRDTLIFWERVSKKVCEFLQDKRIKRRLEPLIQKHPTHEIARYLANS